MDKIIIGLVCISILGIILAINIAPSSKILLTIMMFGMFGSVLFGDDNANTSISPPPPPPRRPPASLASQNVAAITSTHVPDALSPGVQALNTMIANGDDRYDENKKNGNNGISLLNKKTAAFVTLTSAWMLLTSAVAAGHTPDNFVL